MIISTKKLTDGHNGNLFEITAAPAGCDVSDAKKNTIGEVKSELMNIKQMIYLLNHSGGALEKWITNPAILNLYANSKRTNPPAKSLHLHY